MSSGATRHDPIAHAALLCGYESLSDGTVRQRKGKEAAPLTCSKREVTLKRERQAIHPVNQGAQYPALEALFIPHVQSFNALFEDESSVLGVQGKTIQPGEQVPGGLLARIVEHLEPRLITDPSGNKIRYWLSDIQVGRPMLPERERHSKQRAILPVECRERGISYQGLLTAKLHWSVNEGPIQSDTRHLGHLPIMVKSLRCHLHGLSAAQLVQHREESEEMGGYFIVNGIERLIRLLIVPRRHHVIALERNAFTKRGPLYTAFGTSIRCVRDDQTSQTIHVNYLSDGTLMVRFSYRKQEYLIPYILLLKALIPCTDKEIYDRLVQGATENTFLTERVELLLRNFQRYALYTRDQCLAYLGSRFRIALVGNDDDAHRMSDVEVGRDLLRRIVFVHLNQVQDKFDLFIFMAQKLYALVAGDIASDNPDSPMHQEVLLGGHLFLQYLKEKLDDWLSSIKTQVSIDCRRQGSKVDFINGLYWRQMLGKLPSDVGRKLHYFLCTGNLVTDTGLDLQQTTGYTVVAEKLNFYRYISHFRSIHRGSFFAELKTTTVRKLLPESWGFLCPVHTPDGAPCGLLNHLSHLCSIVTSTYCDTSRLPELLVSLGMSPLRRGVAMPKEALSIFLDGKWLGSALPEALQQLTVSLRHLKATRQESVPRDMEIVFIPPSQGGLFPGLFLFTSSARMMRPVRYLSTNHIEMLGSFEQVYLNIACLEKDYRLNDTTHMELAPTQMLSVIANLTPFSDFNQSPRNMYQCQMGKQSMGTPCHAFPYRSDNKLYRLHTGQTPLVRPRLHDAYGMDLYPNGFNAVVAVLAYTGYDMEDAMILNKSSFERGLGHGSVYKSEVIDLTEGGKEKNICFASSATSQNSKKNNKNNNAVDLDGLPVLGQRLKPDDVYYSTLDERVGQIRQHRLKGGEEAIVDTVRVLNDDLGQDTKCRRAAITLRIPRNPIIGDKFSSRHGQKGVCSQKWPAVDMPFSEYGMQPDIIINPHAFPSRMTIGMLLESLAGKSAALHGLFQDATPFQFNEERPAAAYFGEQLLKAGFNYHGNEPLYSGITGTEMHADIYMGCVYYQRLRHMVSDKYQVRTIGPVDQLTQQPIKGRKRAGGIRFGEMERDSLLAHGTSFLLKDRLMNCSDYTQAFVCTACGSLLSCYKSTNAGLTCRSCGHGDKVDTVAMPYVFRYLATELQAMNIKLTLTVQ